jgi:adenine deaminase
LKSLIKASLGQTKSDLVVKNANIYNPFIGDFIKGDLAVTAGRVAGIGKYKGVKEIDAKGQFLISGFIDSHVHIESSMTCPCEFAKTVSAHGTTAVIADPHEIANVCGLKGLKWFLNESSDTPINTYFMAPSCVPASPIERGGANLSPRDIQSFLKFDRVLGLGEMMNYPGVLNLDDDVLAKLSAAPMIDGHSPGITGASLSAYIAAGITTDHECLTPDEALEHLKLGQRVLLRQGTAAKNLLDLLPAVTVYNSQFCHFATDDRHAEDLLTEGSINHLVSLAVKNSALPISAVLNMATLNPAVHYGLRDLGSLSPGKTADMALYPNLTDFKPSMVWHNGKLAAKDGKSVFSSRSGDAGEVRNTVKLGPISAQDLLVKADGENYRVIGVIADQIITESLVFPVKAVNGAIEADIENDVAKMAVWNRYGKPKPPAVGFIKGLGLKRGAIASTVSHDSHNLVAAGMNDQDMIACAQALEKMEGGLAVAKDGRIIASIALPFGGLMSDMSLLKTAAALKNIRSQCALLGLEADADPFMILSFMNLPVIPALKLTVNGLVDVTAFDFVDVVF